MATIKNNPLLKGASGMLGDVVVYRQVRGKVVMSNRPKKTTDPTLQQLNTRARFLEAVQYAKGQMLDPASKEEYAKLVGEEFASAYSAAVADYLKAPRVLSIDYTTYHGEEGDKIVVRAIDNFKVTGVHVAVRSESGALIEEGDAVQDSMNSLNWIYETTAFNASVLGSRIDVAVSDKPGNITRQTQEIA